MPMPWGDFINLIVQVGALFVLSIIMLTFVLALIRVLLQNKTKDQ